MRLQHVWHENLEDINVIQNGSKYIPDDYEHIPEMKEHQDSDIVDYCQFEGVSDSKLYHHPQAAKRKKNAK